MYWVTRTVIRDKLWEKGEEQKEGRGRYKARRVKRAVSIITCNLTASATHHLVSTVPWILIAVSGNFLSIRVEKFMPAKLGRVEKFMCFECCHTISPGSYISLCKGAARPPPTVFSLHPTPPPPCVLYCALLACGRNSFFSNSLFVPNFTKRLWFFGSKCSEFNLQRDFFTFQSE